MAIVAGDKLGPYEILAPIGAGGMGEVYKARDTRLDRIVALKVSKSEFSERFEREARAIAALNHPHICQLYDVGPNYLVMEYVEGQPLGGSLPLDQALRYAGQICEALDTAHKRGIIHRDLKPGNILVTRAGVKLLDFGLAKFAPSIQSSDDTKPMTLTQNGVVLGTLQYMSPEQIDGKEADARSEIYTFGLVLYEMLTGKRAHGPSELDRLQPRALERIVRTCLARDPEARWQSARDLGHVLDSIAVNGLPNSTDAADDALPVRKPWRERTAWILTFALLTGALYYGDSQWHGKPAGQLTRFDVLPIEKAAFSRPIDVTAPVPQFAVSPDGQTIVYAAAAPGARPLLWLRPLRELEARPLPGTDNAVQPFWSPDSAWIGFFADGRLKKVPASGGPVEVIAEGIHDPRGGSWGPDNAVLYSFGNNGIWRVMAEGGPAIAVTKLDETRKEGSHRWPYLLPDGRHFLYTVRGGNADQNGIYAGSLDGKTSKHIARFDSSAVYVKPGFLLYVDGDTLMSQSFDAERLALAGKPLIIGERIGRASLGNAAVSVSDGAVLAYAGTLLEVGRLNWFDRAGNLLGTAGMEEGDYSDFRLSPDNTGLAVSRFDPTTGSADIWLRDLTRGSTTRFTLGSTLNASPVWSPDGGRLVFRTNQNGFIEFYQQGASGAATQGPVLQVAGQRTAGIESTNLVPTDWSPDSRYLLFSVPTKGSGFNLWLLSMTGERTVSNLLPSMSDELQGSFSPDGQLVAYASNESGRFEIYVRTLPLSEKRWTISTKGGYEPRWRADGSELYYLSEDRKLMAVSAGSGPSFGVPKALFQTGLSAGVSAFRTHYVPSLDGRRFLMNTPSDNLRPPSITLTLNWTAALNK